MFCLPKDMMAAQLEKKYKEQYVGDGLAGGKQVIFYASPKESGSFTIVAVEPGGIACILASGTNWQFWKPQEDTH